MLPSAAGIPSDDDASIRLAILLTALQREVVAMEQQRRVRWHPAHAAAARTIATIGEHIVAAAAAEATVKEPAATAPAEASSAEVPSVSLIAASPAILSVRWAPLVTDALLRLSAHPSAAIRLSIARTLHGFISSLLGHHCSASSSTPPQFALDLIAEVGQSALSSSGDFDSAVAAAFQELVALCGVACITTIQTRARGRAAAVVAEEEQAKQAQAAQAASLASSSSLVSPKRSKPSKPSAASSASSVIPAATIISSLPSASGFAPTAAAAASVSSPSIAAASSSVDRRSSVSSDIRSSTGSQSSAPDLDDGPVVDLEDDEADAAEDEDEEEVVEEEDEEEDEAAGDDDGIKSASSPEQEQDGTSVYRFKDGNRRLRERDESSSEEDDEEQQQELVGNDLLAGGAAPEEMLLAGASTAAGSYIPSSTIDPAESSRLLDDSSVTSGRPQQSTSPLSGVDDGAATEATRPISDEEDEAGNTGPAAGELDVNVDDAEDSDAEDNTNGGALAANQAVAPTTTRSLNPALVSLTPAQELAATSPYHALMQQPLSSSFQQHQFQQCLHHLTSLVASHPLQQPMDESWMSYVLLTTHAQVTGEEEDCAIAAAAAPSVSGSASAPPLSHLLSSSRHLASFALLTSCAKYLIKHHLRSRFGAALPTLAHLDRVLTSNIKAKPMEGDSPDPLAAGSGASAAAPASATFVSRLPLQRTLLFMDAFEKLITHASAGGSMSLGMGALADQKSRDFFTANANACGTFFARIRAKLVQASVLADMPAATVYHAQALLQPLMQALSHVWAADTDPKPRTPAATAGAPPPPSALSHSDLLNHRQLLETVNDLSQAYLRLGNVAALAALASLLQSKRFVLSRAAPNASAMVAVAARPLSLFSLCFFIPAVELQARGRLEQAAAEFKRVLAECGSCWSADSTRVTVTAPLLVANSIAFQACIQGLSSCHASLGDFTAAAQDESWTGSVSRDWDKALAGMKSACPSILQPLLPASHTVADVFRWRTASSVEGQNAATTSAFILDRLTAAGTAKLDAMESQSLLAATQGLRHSIRSTIVSATPPQDASIPATSASFLALNSEQQSSLSEDLLLLAMSQKLLGKHQLDSVPSSPDPLQLHAAYALTSWKDSAALSSALVQHRLPEVSLVSSRPSVLSTLAQLELPAAARTLLHVQCAAAIGSENAADFWVAAPIAAAPSLTLLSCDTFHSLRRSQLVASSSQPGPQGRSAALAASSLQLSFVQHALHHGNVRLARSLLAAQLLVPQGQLLSAMTRFVENQDVTAARTELQKLSGVAEPAFASSASADALLPFTFKLSSLSLPSSPSNVRGPASEQALTYLVEFNQQQPGSDPRTVASLLHSAVLGAHGSAPHFWQQHGRLLYIRSLQLASMPASHAHLFDTVTTEDDRSAGGTGSSAIAIAPKWKRSKAKPTSSAEAQSQWVDASEEANRGGLDEDFVQIRSAVSEIKAADASAAAAPIAALTAVVFAINSCLDSRVEDPPPGLVLVRSTSLTPRPAPAVVAPPSLSPAELSWFNRLREVLWQAVCKALPQLVAAAGFDQFYSTMLNLACRRAVRLLAYAESALTALIQAQQLLANPTSDAYARAHPARSHAEMPLAILTLLTRFGSELSVGQSLVILLLALAPKSFLAILPQLFARVGHPSPVVRGLLQALVCQIGEQFPHEVVFPLCVAMHEEEEWKRDEERCRDIEAAAAAAAAGEVHQATSSNSADRARSSSSIVTPKHEMLLRMVHAIDRRSVSTLLAQRSSSPQQLHSQVLSLFASSSSLPSSTSRGSFMVLLSSVHRLLLELNRLAFLQEDSWLWEFRRLQSELDFGGGGGASTVVGAAGAAAAAAAAASAPGARGRMVAEELENMLLQWREDQKRQAGVVGGPAAVAAAASKAPTPQFVAQLRARYDIILGPLLHQLLELQRSTLAVPAATPHELHFQRKYGRALQQLVSSLVAPADDVLLRPAMLWNSISLKINDLRRTMSRLSHLHLASISPFLSKFHSSAVDASAGSSSAAAQAKRALRTSKTNLAGSHVDPASNYAWYSALHASHAPRLYLAGMQGTEELYENSHPNPAAFDASATTGCFLVSFSSSIELLRTKTRPKKLSMFGSDGQTHTYLLKSREDLHLDQAMMQWIRLANRSLYQRWRGCNTAHPSVECLLARSQQQPQSDHICASHYPSPLYARTFSVIPLSDKSGLIKWIDGVVAIFDLVKHEQNRRKEREERTKAAALAAAGDKGAKLPAPAAQIIKPSELFSHKLLHHLHAAGLHKSTARKDIPLHVLLSVFDEMQSEGGEPHLLQKELWLSSATPSEWLLKIQSFTRSLSSMSLIGYILGLGDRHLGNMMVSPSRGDVLHIDYNISLERGLKLPIPEIVPWRMTNILTRVGGIAGMGGTGSGNTGNFAQGCLIVLSTLRAQEHMFSSMLGHRFIYAPLSEWKSLSAKPFLTLRKQSEMTLSAKLLKARLESSVVVSGAAPTSSSVLQPVTNLTRIADLARMVSPSEGSLVLESVDACFVHFGRLLPMIRQLDAAPPAPAVLHAELLAIVGFQLLHSSPTLQTLAEREPAMRMEMGALLPRIQGALGAIGGLCASTATILSKQSALLHAIAATPSLNVLWGRLHAGRTESTDDAAGAANEVYTLVGPLVSDSRRFAQSFTHLSHVVTLLPVAFHPPSPHPSITLPAAALKADEQLGLLMARFKGALFELNALLVFYRHVSDVVVHTGSPAMAGMPAPPPTLQLQSATSSFVFHLLEEYLRAPLPPITPDSNKHGHTALLQSLAARLQGFHHQSHGSCIVLSASHAFAQYSSLHSSLLSCHAALHRKFQSLESMLLHSLGGGGKVESGEDLNPARHELPGSLQLAMYPPSLHQFVTRAREGYAKVCSALSLIRSQMLDRFSSAATLNQALAAVGWSAPAATFNLGASSMMGGLQIVDDIAAQYAVDHVVNLLTCLQMWHWVQNLLPQLMQSATQKNPVETASAGSGKKQVKSLSASSSSSPVAPAVAPMHPLVTTVTFFPLHTQLTLLLSSLCASTSFLGARFLHQELSSAGSAVRAPSSNLVPSSQPAKVEALYDHRAFVSILGLCSQLEDLVASVPQQVANLFARAVDAAFAPQPQQQLQQHVARPEVQWSHASNELLVALRHLRARLRVLLSTAHGILQEEVQESKNAAYEAQRAAEAQAAAAAQANRLNYASAMRPKTFNAAPTSAPAPSKPSVSKTKRAELALHMTQLLSEYEALKLPSSAALAAAQKLHQQMAGPPPTFAAVFALLDSQYTRVELQYLEQARFIAPWTLSPHMYSLVASSSPIAAISSSAMGCLPLQFGVEELAFIETFVHTKIDGIVGQLSMLASLVDSELSAASNVPAHLQRRVSVLPAVSSPRVLAELQSGYLDKYASAVLLPLVAQHITAKIGSYLLPSSEDVLARVTTESEASKRPVNIPAWIANATGAAATSAMKPTLQRSTEVLFAHSLGALAADSLSTLFAALHSYTLQSTTLDASFHVMQSELRGLSSEIQDLCGTLPAARWAAMRFAWEASTPLYVALREDPQAFQAHQAMKVAEIEAVQQLSAHHTQLSHMISSMPSLHSSLLGHLHSIHAASAHAESDVMQNGSLPPEPAPLSLLSIGVGSGPVWKLGAGYGAELRSYLLHRLQTAMESLSSIEHELTGWSGAVYDALESRMMIAFRGWGDSDRVAEAGCNRVIHEANQRCILLRTQTQQTAPQLLQLAGDILQLERYRLDPPPLLSASSSAVAAGAALSSGPADEFLFSTSTILLLAIQALQAEQSVFARQARIRAVGQEEANCRALAEEQLQWLQKNDPSTINSALLPRLHPQLMALAAKQLPRWSARCIALFPSLLPLLDLLTRLLRDTRSTFAHVTRSGGQWEVGREAARLKAELEQMHALLTAFVQQQPAGGIAEGQRLALEPFVATYRLYMAMSAPDAASAAAAAASATSADPNSSLMLLSSSTPLHDQARATFDALARLPALISTALAKDLANAAAAVKGAEELPSAGPVTKEERNK